MIPFVRLCDDLLREHLCLHRCICSFNGREGYLLSFCEVFSEGIDR